jgi:hypothetical protein
LDPPQLRSKKKKEDKNLFLIPLAYTPPDDDRKTKWWEPHNFLAFSFAYLARHTQFLFPYFSFRCERPEREETTPGETLQGRRPSHTDLAAVSFTFFVFLIFTIYLFIYLIVIFLNLFLIPAVFVFLSASDLLKHGGNDYIFKFLFFYLLIFFIIFIKRRNSLLKKR